MFKKQACKHAHQPIMTTEHRQDRKCLIFPEGGKPDCLENLHGTTENQRTTRLTYGPGRDLDLGRLGERGAHFAHTSQPCHGT